MQLDFECNLAMFRFMRLAYCRSVIIKFGVLRSTDPHLASDFVAAVPQFQTALERFFVDSIAHEVAVDSLQVACRTEKIAKLVPRKG